MSARIAVIKLDDQNYGAGPGTVVAIVDTLPEYLALITDRDGAIDRRMRAWSDGGRPTFVGERVRAASEEELAALARRGR